MTYLDDTLQTILSELAAIRTLLEDREPASRAVSPRADAILRKVAASKPYTWHITALATELETGQEQPGTTARAWENTIRALIEAGLLASFKKPGNRYAKQFLSLP